MNSMLDRFISELTRGLYQSTPPASYVPTLVVGLGGTGLKVLRGVKAGAHEA
ncbi:MAG TPA: hypothetical protein PKE26_16810 [Kiritimatiellia bacterium]|nr:hypothetical protein [Kiritimatiellia bacterium]HMO52824.1 hypothetical protein [Kiritimatiellia bacterium]HMO99922.1 hypothetical protein [Kiritimatiellia bacterium]HMP00759.1 hypothetical protein [Kiritimatiellia bacterium]